MIIIKTISKIKNKMLFWFYSSLSIRFSFNTVLLNNIYIKIISYLILKNTALISLLHCYMNIIYNMFTRIIKQVYIKIIIKMILHPFLIYVVFIVIFYLTGAYFNIILAEETSLSHLAPTTKVSHPLEGKYYYTTIVDDKGNISFKIMNSFGLGPALKSNLYPQTFKAMIGQSIVYNDAFLPIYLKNLLNEHFMIISDSVDDIDQIKNGLNYVKNKMPSNFWSTSEASLKDNSSTFNQFIEHLPRTEQGLRFGASLIVYNNLLVLQQTSPGFQCPEQMLPIIYNDTYIKLRSCQ